MRKILWVAGFIALGILPGPSAANPVADSEVNGFRNSILTTARSGHAPNPNFFIDEFGRFGLNFLSGAPLQALQDSLHLFAPFLVSSQTPGQHHSLSPALQDLYRHHATPEEAKQMILALRKWLTAEITEAPAEGSMWTVGGPGAQREIDNGRAIAAQLLFEWGDLEALPLMEALDKRGLSSPRATFALRRTIRRFKDPCAMTFLQAGPGDSLQCCEFPKEVKEAVLGKGDWQNLWPAPKYPRYTLNSREVSALWPLVQSATILRGSKGNRGWASIVIDFRNGLMCSLTPGDSTLVEYSDNTSPGRPTYLTLNSRQLRDWIMRLANAHGAGDD